MCALMTFRGTWLVGDIGVADKLNRRATSIFASLRFQVISSCPVLQPRSGVQPTGDQL